jgi:hypothetical protein
MKLERTGAAVAITLAVSGAVSGCAASAPHAAAVEARERPATTHLTSADEASTDEASPDDAEAPRVGKSQRALELDPDAVDAKRPRRGEGERRSGFGSWK